ncbi:lymphocyte antigen 75 isoform X1 [Alosa sapidissima]|uniref:lymphocyte antigen 75 isoform X1 n=1 Tax=Alosa sapidissima TaxID=34773 RepID=UPI001C07F68C|nr:lymphocyte antigen 75 isoform X1 [Alosa sapidissima]
MSWNIQAKHFTVLLAAFLGGFRSSYFGYCAPSGNSGDDAFTIQHVNTTQCLVAGADTQSLALANCTNPPGPRLLWKWGSGNRLFHVGSSRCLGLEVHKKALALSDCDSQGTMLKWLCVGQAVYTNYEMGLTRDGNTAVVIAKRKPTDGWTRGDSKDNICQQPYKTIHTRDGNALGAPCAFPFRYNGTWHHRCLPGQPGQENLPEGMSWCSPTMNYDQQRRWGFCLQYVEGCHTLWENATNGHCYQTVATAAVTWHQARDSCRSQGGDLLSVSSASELKALEAMDLPDKLWIGLNQMDWAEGWQWSDGSPLHVVNWATDMPTLIGLGELDCGVLISGKQYENAMCEKKLPYICKKLSSPVTQPTERVVYKSTVCEDGWFPWDSRCLRLFEEVAMTQSMAQDSCTNNNASLLSIHSLEDMFMFNVKLPSERRDLWSGLTGDGLPLVFKWLDGSEVNYTHWAKDHPRIDPSTRFPICVRFTGENHEWMVSGCDLSLPYLCVKQGVVNESVHDEGCPEGDWRRHGDACYKADPNPVSFKQNCNLTITDRFEQVFINRLLREQLGSKAQFFWTGLQDIKGNGEYGWTNGENVTFTNWGWGEPDLNGGGCAVMSTNRPLGKWYIKNCSLFEAGTICKKYLKAPMPVPQININAPCPTDWFSKPGIPYCYKVFHEERLTRTRTWVEAEGFCRSLGAHLPSFGHVDEMTALHSVMRDTISDDRYFWVGLNRRNPNNENAWEWSDGRPLSTSMFPMEIHEDDEYNRDCTAFKSLRGSFHLFFFFMLHDLPPRPFYATPFHCDAPLEWACQIPRGATPKIPAWYNPGGFHNTSVFVDGEEFWFEPERWLSYEEASLYCSSNSSRLAAPASTNAIRAIQQKMQQLSRSVYLNWWADLREVGSAMPSPFTQLHLYRSGFLGRCASLGQDSAFPEYDQRCSEKLPFVCEVLNVTTAEAQPIGPHPQGLPCDAGSVAFRDKCYTVVTPVETTAKKAGEICKGLRGQLLTIRDQVEQDFITTLLPSLPLRTWIGLKLKLRTMQWADNTPVDYLNFHPLVHGQYRRMHINAFSPEALELCAYIFSDPNSDMLGTWDYTFCTDFQNVSICQHYADKPEVAQISKDTFHVLNHTYQLVQQENMTWFDALELCKNQNMELASVADAFQQAVLTVNVSRLGKPLWIGLYSEDDGQYYQWTDRSHTMFSRWSKESTAGRCVYLDTDGFWKATECGQGLSGAICHIPHEDVITPEHTSRLCPHKGNGPNWFPYKDNCYTFQLVHSRWEHQERGQFQQTCLQLHPDAVLLTIRDEDENAFLREKLQPLKDLAFFVWLGLYKDNATQQLKWYDDTYVQYSNWKGGRPEVNGQFLAGLSLDGSWDLFSKEQYFQHFKQRSVVACKIERNPKDEFKISPWEARKYINYSYHVVGRKLTWFQAQEECARGGGHLASIHNATQGTELLAMAKRDGFPLWIGLSNQDVSFSNGSHYEWSDGSEFDYIPTGFHKGSVVDGCVFMDTSGMWMSISCQERMEGALCYNSTLERTSPRKALKSNRCPKTDGIAQWMEHEDHCYAFDMTFYNFTVYTLDDAKRVCKELDSSAHLLSIKSEVENDFISKYIRDNPHITSHVWLGLESDTKNLRWMDDSKVDFFKWNKDQKLTYLLPNICAVMLTNEEGTWRQTSCRDSRSRIVCKAPMRSSGITPAVIFCIIVIPAILGIALYVVFKKTRHHFFSAVRYQRSFDEVDSTSIINDTE